MKKTKINIIIILAILITSFASNYALAQGRCQHNGKDGMPGGGMGQCDRNMSFIQDLTADQQKQIDALKLNFIKEKTTIQNLIDEKQAHLKTISTGDNVDMAAVNKTIDELFALKADLHKKHMVFQQDVRKLLTADQKVIFDIHAGKGKGHGMGKAGCKNGGDCQRMGKACKQAGSCNGSCKGNCGNGQGCGNMHGCQQGRGQGNGPGGCKKN